MTWLPSVSGRPIDLVNPLPHEIDFAEIAFALSHLNRSSGNAQQPVSVGLHTLIGFDLVAPATPRLRALWLLHDCHEFALGDPTAPYKEAAHEVATSLFGPAAAAQLDAVRKELEGRHDVAIHAAAGLPLPDALERQALRTADLRALATERRDFYRRGPAPRPWLVDALGIAPGPKVRRWQPPVEVEAALLSLFRTHLPALAARRRVS